MNKNVKNFIIKPLKVLAWIVGSIIFLVLLIVLATRIPFVQEIIKDKAISFFKEKTNTEASIGSLYVNFPSGVELNSLYIEDLQGDTLVYCQQITVDTNLLGLLDNELSLDDIYVKDLYANIHNSPSDSTFNFQFILDAFVPVDTTITPQDTTATPFSFGVYGLEAETARVIYNDAFNGMILNANIGYLAVEASVFDLNSSQIYVESIQLQDSRGSFKITKAIPESDDTPTAPFYVNGRQILISDVDFTFEDEPGGIRVVNSIGQANIKADSINIVDQIYDAREITILDSYVSVDMFDVGGNEPDTLEDSSSKFSLLASSENITLGSLDVRYYDHSQPILPNSFDPAHIWAHQINLQAENLVFHDGTIQGTIDRLNLTEAHGMAIQALSTTMALTETEAYLHSLNIQTRQSILKGNFEVSYSSLDELMSAPEETRINLDIDTARIVMDDIIYFVPDLLQDIPVNLTPNSSIAMDGQISGTLARLTLDDIDVRAFGGTSLQTSGVITGLPDVGRLHFDVPELSFQTTRQDVYSVLADTLIPPGINLPEQIALRGKINGTLKDINSDLLLNTSLGDLSSILNLKMDEDSIYHYTAHIEANELMLGELLSDPNLGETAFVFDVEGEGIEPETLNTSFEGVISTFFYSNYPYDSIILQGSLEEGRLLAKVELDDPNLAFEFDGEVLFEEEANKYSFDLDVPRADLRALHLFEGEFQLVSNVTSDLSGSSVDDLNGYLKITDTHINRNDRILSLDSLYFLATAREDSTSYHLFSDFLEFDFAGTFEISLLPVVIEQHFSKYYELEKDTTELTELRPQSFAFDVNIKDPRFFTYMLPGLTSLEPGKIAGTYNSSEWLMDLEINIYALGYTGIEVDSIQILVNSDEYALTYSLGATSVIGGPVIMKNILLDGDVESDRIMANLHILDDEGEDRYLFGGIFISLEDYFRFMFTPGKVITNYHSWDIKPSNAINFYENDVWVENLFAEYEDQSLRFYSNISERGDSVQTLELENFRLAQFGRMTEDSVAFITGTVNGQSDFNAVSEGLAFTSDLTITDFGFKGDTLGNVSLQADTDNGMLYEVDMGINSPVNDIQLTGSYTADSISTIDMRLDINRLSLNTIESFTAGQLTNMKGHVEGDILITGNTLTPDIDGTLRFQEASFTPTYLGTTVSIDDQQLRLNNSGIQFNNFTIRDADDDPARISGTITTKDLLVYSLDLEVELEEFLVIDRPLPDAIPESSNPFYGHLDVTSSVQITGTSQRPRIDLNASFSNGSSFTYVIPEETITEQEQEGVVEWFDQDVENIDFFTLNEDRAKDSVQQALEGIDLTANITVRPGNSLSIVIDPVTGDRLTVNGNADLTYNILPSGNQSLSGRFEVTSGSYNLNFYDLIKRKFIMQEGSYILWTGDPLNAIMNVTAIYQVRAAPIGVAEYSGKLDFLVYLDIGGQLLQPDISFRLGLAPDTPAPIQVEAWVSQQNSQEERVNKQVFGLLLFQSFFPDDSYGSAGSGNLVANTARSSVSKLLSAQLNRLSDQIAGVDLTFDIDSYEDFSSSGDSFGRTELELGLSKELFNERVVVKLAGNIDLEGNRSRQGVSDFAGDVQIEYKLTEDGRFRLLGFRNNDFDNLQGEIIRTGVGVIYIREYNAFRELFQKSREEKGEKND